MKRKNKRREHKIENNPFKDAFHNSFFNLRGELSHNLDTSKSKVAVARRAEQERDRQRKLLKAEQKRFRRLQADLDNCYRDAEKARQNNDQDLVNQKYTEAVALARLVQQSKRLVKHHLNVING